MTQPHPQRTRPRCEYPTPLPPQLVLASGSSARAALLAEKGLDFQIRPASIDEAAVKRAASRCGYDATWTARRLAWLKARQVARLRADPEADAILVIGADQMLELDTDWFDKPADLDAAFTQLRRLSGRTHRLWSAVSLWRDRHEVFSSCEMAELTMRQLDDTEIAAYLRAEGPGICGSVGAYRIEGAGAGLFERVRGARATIMGLPLTDLLTHLAANGIKNGDVFDAGA